MDYGHWLLAVLIVHLILMGGGQSRSSELLRFVEREWEVLKEQGGKKLLRNVETEVQAELVPLMLDPRRLFEKECDIYNYRRTQENALVGVYSVQNLKDGEGSLCGSTQVVRVAVERTLARWGDLGEISFPDSLYALSQSIRGFDDCFIRIKLFQITNRMIALNTKGAVRVWLNENFADNHPVDEKPHLQMVCVDEGKLKSSREELIMLQNLLNVIEEKCQGGRFPEDFRSRIYAKSNFVDAYNQVELYCRERNLDLPDRIVPNRSFSNTSNSISQSKMQQKPINATFGNNEPRETLIKTLSFSNANYLESPQLRKYEAPESQYEPSQLPLYQPPISPRFSLPPPTLPMVQSGQIRFNVQSQQQGNAFTSFGSRGM